MILLSGLRRHDVALLFPRTDVGQVLVRIVKKVKRLWYLK
jgi:hypothetical protein